MAATSFSATFCSRSPPIVPIVMAAYPVSAIDSDSDAVIVAAINLDWMSKIMGNLAGRPGISAVLDRQRRNRDGGAGGSRPA